MRCTSTSQSCIDHVYCNRKEMVKSYGVIPCGFSDHSIVYVQRSNCRKQEKASYIFARSFSKFNPQSFIDDIGMANWERILNEPDPNLGWEAFKEIFIPVCNKHAPYRSITRLDE